MKVEISTPVEIVSITQTFPDKGMVTMLKVATQLQPGEVARILNMRRQGAPLIMTIGSEQLMFDLVVETTKIDVPAKGS
ncbi:MAG: hypothetical protein MUO97_06545 [Dehalococcoidia bacterium]|nr:hypothetical protein [Dehalococcoidia bacterium]